MRYLIGLGNYLMFDDSIGIRIIEYISERGLDADFRALDVSGNALNILSYLNRETEKILIVDAVNMGEKPGDFRFFTLDDVVSVKSITGITTHEDDMVQVLRLAQDQGYSLPEIVFLGIEPESVRMDCGLSDSLVKRFTQYVEVAMGALSAVK